MLPSPNANREHHFAGCSDAGAGTRPARRNSPLDSAVGSYPAAFPQPRRSEAHWAWTAASGSDVVICSGASGSQVLDRGLRLFHKAQHVAFQISLIRFLELASCPTRLPTGAL